MSSMYESFARDVVRLVGGKKNVTQAYHCATRLRFILADESIADEDALKALDGTMGVIRAGGQFQVVVGPHVADVFEEVEKLVDVAGAAEAPAPKGEKKSPIDLLIDFVAGTFQPIIPALSGAGMVKAVMALLTTFGVIAADSQTYQMLNIFADGVFYFLPVLLAFTEAQKLKCNPILAAGVAAMMLHPNWSAFVAAGEPVNFFEFIPFTLASYGSSVIPIILVVFVQSLIEKWLNRHVPASVNLVFVPMITFILMGTLAFSVLGPIGAIVGSWLSVFFTFLAENAAWLPAVLIGGLCPIMVMFGIHNGIAPLGPVQMADLGYDSIWGPGNIVSNMCQATAGVVVALRDPERRNAAFPGAITAYMGITEPILYGTNLPLKYPLYASMIGGAVGGLYAGLSQTHRFATGSGGLPAVLLYIGDGTMVHMVNIIIAMVLGSAVTAILTFVLGNIYDRRDARANGFSVEPKATDAAVVTSVVAPVAGAVRSLSEADDPAFSSLAMGDGAAIDPVANDVVAPISGLVTVLFPTAHAVGITADDGTEVLVHIGIDTVCLEGKPFDMGVAQGDRVEAGQVLGKFDRAAIEAAGCSAQVMVVVTDKGMHKGQRLAASGAVSLGDELIAFEN